MVGFCAFFCAGELSRAEISVGPSGLTLGTITRSLAVIMALITAMKVSAPFFTDSSSWLAVNSYQSVVED